MDLPNGHSLRLPEAFQGPLLPYSQMEHCAAPQTAHCIHKSADPSEMAPFGSCMPLALVIVVPVCCAHVVKKAVLA